MTTPNELRTIAQRLHEYKANSHHINPMSEAFFALVVEAANALTTIANTTGQVMGRVHHRQDGSVVCALNSVGRELPDDTKLFASAELATAGETDAESRTAWIAVVLQKYPEASIRVANQLGVANTPNGMVIGNWMPGAWSVK